MRNDYPPRIRNLNRIIVPGKALAFRPPRDVSKMMTRAIRSKGCAYSKLVVHYLRKGLAADGYATEKELREALV